MGRCAKGRDVVKAAVNDDNSPVEITPATMVMRIKMEKYPGFFMQQIPVNQCKAS